jgi:hypothetical protein
LKEEQVATSKADAAAPQVTIPVPVPVRTSDSADANKNWTVQSDTPFEITSTIPGQVFIVGQLPVPALQVAAGIDPASSNAGLVVVTDAEAAAHPGGPEPTDNVLLNTPVDFPGTVNAGALTVAGDPAAPAVVSTVPNVPPVV